MSSDGDTTRIVDERAARWAARLVTPTRTTSRSEVARLRTEVTSDMPAIDRAARTWTQLGSDLPPTEVAVVGRYRWVDLNLAAVRSAFDPLAEKLRGDRRIASKVLGAQIGALLGVLSTRVLGQYVLPLSEPGSGRLVVVGPNLLQLSDDYGIRAEDLRRTVLLHEVTHRLQFDGVPWLGDHLRDLLARYLAETRIDAAALLETAARLPEAIQRVRVTGSVQPLVEAVLAPAQVDIVREAQGLMSLLEGHGNAAMFLGAGGVVDDVAAVRDALERRRGDVTSRLLSAVAGMEMKKRQYREGEAFVRAVVADAGVEGLNRAFADPRNLPTQEEVTDPAAWLQRVGDAA